MFDLGQLIFFMRYNKIHSATVLSRMIIENAKEEQTHTFEQEKLFTPFGPSGVTYGTCHGAVPASEAFGTRQDLLNSL